MPVHASVAEGAVRLSFDQPEEIAPFFQSAQADGGFLLEVNRALKLYTVVPFHLALKASAELDFAFDANVIQSFATERGFRTAFQLSGWNPARQMELTRKVAAAEQAATNGDSLGGETLGAGRTGTPRAAAAAAAATSATESPATRIRELKVPERMRLAIKAGRVERQVLLRDHSPQILLGLIGNPRIEDKEVLEIVKSTHVTGAILKRVAGNRRWLSNQEVRTAIVRNPKTPTPLAIRLLEGLRTPDLSVLAKAGAAREPLRKAALNLYLKRVQGR